MVAKADNGPVSISLLALPDSTPAALYGLYEVFSSVGTAWAELTGEPAAGRAIDARIVAPGRDAFPCAIGTPIAPHASLDEAAGTDVVVVGDLSFAAAADPRGRWPAASRWVREQFDSGATVCSVCTGSVLLADAGLLDGEEATTHWGAAPLFRTFYPAVKLRPERILVPAGPEHRIITGGGASSWEDLALYLIARFCSEAEAVRTAKILSLIHI